ncbi:unnamed protein product [Phyllotreta striolata]|uniref:Uncharacterized protein n=1 Tax=Phyllotreta striolata TaxID=444603 RepID=A0A9N9TQM3_PHYSR|nr:unnamed protein product [Phyllotreta striolata]
MEYAWPEDFYRDTVMEKEKEYKEVEDVGSDTVLLIDEGKSKALDKEITRKIPQISRVLEDIEGEVERIIESSTTQFGKGKTITNTRKFLVAQYEEDEEVLELVGEEEAFKKRPKIMKTPPPMRKLKEEVIVRASSFSGSTKRQREEDEGTELEEFMELFDKIYGKARRLMELIGENTNTKVEIKDEIRELKLQTEKSK